ncbi:MAG: hypothetical protein KY428_03880 [Bacteroidetes bacterium]|nr:hypothetical protein [Bacteroidota bacterium]
MKLFSFIFPLALFMGWSSCNGDAQTMEADCPENIICTEQFEIIQLKLTNTNNQPVALNSFKSTNLDTGQEWKLEQEFTLEPNSGYYPVLTDAQMKEVAQEGSRIEFIGIINGQKVVKELYVIGHDCCHIKLISGEQDIQLPAGY